MANWFEQNAPPTTAAPPPPSGNWFTQNAPPAGDTPQVTSTVSYPNLEHAINTFAESSGAKLAGDLLGGGAKALMERAVGNAPDTAAEQRFTGGFGGLAGFFKNEPYRMADQLHKSMEAATKGDINAMADHLWYAVPFAGAAGEAMADYLKKGDYVGAFAHAAGTLAPVAHEPVAEGVSRAAEATGRAVEATGRGVRTAATATGGAAGEMLRSAPAAVGGALEGGMYGLFGGPGGAIIGAKIGAARVLRNAATRGARNALAERAAAEASAIPPVSVEPVVPEVIPPERQITQGDIVTPAPADTSFVRGVPAEYPPIPPERRITQGDIIPPAPADTSYVRAVPAEYPAAEQPQTAAAPPPAETMPAAAEDLRSAMGLQPGEMEAPAAAPEDTAAAAIARQQAANALIKAISPAGVSSDLVANIPAETWNQIAELAKLPPPDPATIETVIKTVAAKEGRPAPSTPRIEEPAAAAAPVTEPAPEPAPPSANPAEALATEMPGYKPPAPEEGPAPPTAAESRIEQIAKAVAADQRIPLHIIEDPELYPTFFEQVAQQMKLNRPAAGEPEAILARVRELRGGTAEPPPAAAAPPSEEAGPRFDQEQRAAEVEHAQTLEEKFKGIVADLRATAGDKAEQIIREQLPSRYPGWVGSIPTEELHADPVRFQYKMDVGQGGAGAKLKGTQVWNPDLAGTIQVWKDPANGKTYVVNGHHRLELAKRLGVQDVKVDYLHASDATEARVKGALTNIAEGNGSVMDAAKLFRDTGMTPDQVRAQGIALDGRIARPGMAISKLNPTLFQAVLSGDIPESRGAILGELPAADQLGMYKLIEQAERRSGAMKDSDVAEMVRLSGTAPKITEQHAGGAQGGMFDDEAAPVERSLAPEKAQVSGYIRDQLKQEKRLFGVVSSQAAAERLGAAGNVIEAAKNQEVTQRAKQVQDLYDRLSTVTGPVDQALNAAARAIAEGENARSVYERTYRSIRDELEQQLRKYAGEKPGSAAGTPLFDDEGPDKTGSR